MECINSLTVHCNIFVINRQQKITIFTNEKQNKEGVVLQGDFLEMGGGRIKKVLPRKWEHHVWLEREEKLF